MIRSQSIHRNVLNALSLVVAVWLLASNSPAAGGETPARHLLAEPITMKSGVYNPWTDRCSDADAPVRREIYIRQPAGDGQFPVIFFFVGTLRSPHNPTARSIVDRAAELGFVAASVDYDTIASDFHAVGECDSIQAKARCTMTVDDPAPVATTTDTCREESVAAIRRILVEKRPSIWQCDDTAEHLEVVEIVAADGGTPPRRVIERALSTWRPAAAIERIEHTVAVVTLSDDRQLGEAMGSTGAYCYLASLTATLTSLPGIDAVWLEIEEGSHAGPGLYSRSSFLEMFDLTDSP